MSKKPFDTENKNMTFGQYLRYRREQEEAEKRRKETMPAVEVKPGRCPECDNTKFSLRAEPGILIRTCETKGCGDVQIFD